MRYLPEHNRIDEAPMPFEVEEYPADYNVIGSKIVKNIT
ncbi:hypothetical protein B0H39_005782 [Clostridium beijerinckii]|nr:hypothetical protein [Clostridium beijerinckii]